MMFDDLNDGSDEYRLPYNMERQRCAYITYSYVLW